MGSRFGYRVLWAWVLVFALAGTAVAAGRDVVMVLDNSGSMRGNDSGFLIRGAVSGFIERLPDGDRVAMVIFDHAVDLAVPLTPLNAETRPDVLASLKRIDYRGRYTDSPGAMERAVYELKTTGRLGAQRHIVFLTDGIVDTGNRARDLESAEWLRRELADDAAQHEIRVFGLAFTRDADLQLIQSLAVRTGGDYFRAPEAADLTPALTRVADVILALEDPGPPRTDTPAVTETPATPDSGDLPAGAPDPVVETARKPEMEVQPPATAPEPGIETQAAEPALVSGMEPQAAEAVLNPGLADQAGGQTPEADTGSEALSAEAPDSRTVESREWLFTLPDAVSGQDDPARPAESAMESSMIPDIKDYGEADAERAAIDTPLADSPTRGELQLERLTLAVAALAVAVFLLLLYLLLARGRPRRMSEGLRTDSPGAAVLAFLDDIDGVTDKSRHELISDRVTVGRGSHGDVPGGQHIRIRHDTVSRLHGSIEKRSDGYWAVDKGSINGVFVNDSRVDGECRLADGDRIRFYQFNFRFQRNDWRVEDEDAALGATLIQPSLDVSAPGRQAARSPADGDTSPETHTQPLATGPEEDRLDATMVLTRKPSGDGLPPERQAVPLTDAAELDRTMVLNPQDAESTWDDSGGPPPGTEPASGMPSEDAEARLDRTMTLPQVGVADFDKTVILTGKARETAGDEWKSESADAARPVGPVPGPIAGDDLDKTMVLPRETQIPENADETWIPCSDSPGSDIESPGPLTPEDLDKTIVLPSRKAFADRDDNDAVAPGPGDDLDKTVILPPKGSKGGAD